MFDCVISSTTFQSYFFFFQAEDGIRDADVTGVQTCALPISHRSTAIPTQSNPDPRLAVDPGTRTVTVALMRGIRCPGKRDLVWRRKLPGSRIERQARHHEELPPVRGGTRHPGLTPAPRARNLVSVGCSEL